jgi:hypothetical protein
MALAARIWDSREVSEPSVQAWSNIRNTDVYSLLPGIPKPNYKFGDN